MIQKPNSDLLRNQPPQFSDGYEGSIYSSLTDGILILDDAGCIQFANKTAITLLGDVLNTNGKADSALKSLIENQEKLEIKHPDGTIIHLQAEHFFETVQNHQTHIILLKQKTQETLYKHLFEGVQDAIIVESLSGEILDELSALQAVTNASIIATDENELIEKATQILNNLFYSDHVGVLLVDETENVLRVHPSYIGIPEDMMGMKISIGHQGIADMVAKTGKTWRVSDVSEAAYLGVNSDTQSEFCVPIQVGNKIVGIIHAESRHRDGFNNLDERLMTTLAGQLGSGIERLRSEAAEKYQRIMAQTVNKTATLLNESLDVEEVLDQILANIVIVIPSNAATIVLIEHGRTKIARQWGYKNLNLDSWLKKLENEMIDFPNVQLLLNTHQPILIEDTKKVSDWITFPETNWIRSHIAAPITNDGEILGFVNLDHEVPGFYSSEHVENLKVFTQHVAIALKNARLYQSAVDSAMRNSVLHEVGQQLSAASKNGQMVYKTIHRAVNQLMPAEAFTIVRILQEQNEFEIEYGYDKSGRLPVERFPLNTGISGKVFESGKSLLINDLEAYVGDYKIISDGDSTVPLSVLAVPMIYEGMVTGVLTAQAFTKNSYSEDDLRLLEMLAAQTSVTLENARLFEDISIRKFELETIAEISLAMRKARSREEMLPVILDQLVDLLHVDSALIMLIDEQSKNCVIESATGNWKSLNGEIVPSIALSTDQNDLSQDVRNNKLQNDLTDYVSNFVDGSKSLISAPLITPDQMIGVLCVVRNEMLPHDITRLIGSIADITANAVHRIQLHEKTEQRLARLTTLRTIDMSINSSMNLSLILDVLITEVTSQLRMDAADVLLLDNISNELVFAACYGYKAHGLLNYRIHMTDAQAGKVLLERRTLVIPDLKKSRELINRPSFLVEENFRAYVGIPLIAKGQVLGVLEVYHHTSISPDREWLNFLESLAGQAAIAVDNARMFESLQRSHLELSLAYDKTLEGWVHALDLRDRETEEHTQRVTKQSVRLARAMGITEKDLVDIRRGALLHDIGKMGIPDEILNKPGPLDSKEWEIMHQHPLYAYRLLSPIPYLKSSLDIPYCHHERWDGSGYPRNLKSEMIPLSARIFTVVDVWDALLTNRPYREAWDDTKIKLYIQSSSGTQFDPLVVEKFLELLETDQDN